LAIAWRERSIRVFLTLEMLTAGAVSILLGSPSSSFSPSIPPMSRLLASTFTASRTKA